VSSKAIGLKAPALSTDAARILMLFPPEFVFITCQRRVGGRFQRLKTRRG
jgi:hypothetical protein